MNSFKKSYETIIIGAGISGLACARKLDSNAQDFLMISKDIGGRILTSEEGTVNYGAFFVCSDYDNVLKYCTLKSRIRLSDFCFHQDNNSFVLYQLKIIPFIFQFIKIKRILYQFRKKLRLLRQKSKSISQKEAIENDDFLYSLYMKNAVDFVKEYSLEKGNEVYLSKALYSTTFSKIDEMNAFSYLQFLIPLITPIYTFKFERDKMIKSFKEKIRIAEVTEIQYKNHRYEVKVGKDIFVSNNIVLATEITWSQKFAGVKKFNKPVNTNMLHVSGKLKNVSWRKKYHLFFPESNVQAIANLFDGTFLFYYKKEKPDLNNFFKNPKAIAHRFWNPAGTINGHNLIDCRRGNNMYLIGDYNIAGLEESFITGIYAANQIINSG